MDHLSDGRIFLGVGIGDTGESVGSDVSLTHFGQAAPPRQRAAMLDEALEVLVGLWSGKPFNYQGQYYRVGPVTYLPRPVQSPRIPVWVGGGWPLKGPSERADRWDGSLLYKHRAHFMQPEDIRALRALVHNRRGSLDGYDIVVGGSPRRDNWDEERSYIRSLAESGATWWNEYLPPDSGDLELVRTLVARGPLRID